MLTLGYIIGPANNLVPCYKWYVNIPILHGIPNSSEEASMFRDLFERQDEIERLRQQEEETNDYTLVAKYKESMRDRVVSSLILSENDKNYCVVADSCLFSGTSVQYNVGDAVVIGFMENKMSKPMILGMWNALEQSKQIYHPTNNINVTTLQVDRSASLPSNTTFKYIDQGGKINTISIQDIMETINFIKAIQGSGLTIQKLLSLLKLLTK